MRLLQHKSHWTFFATHTRPLIAYIMHDTLNRKLYHSSMRNRAGLLLYYMNSRIQRVDFNDKSSSGGAAQGAIPDPFLILIDTIDLSLEGYLQDCITRITLGPCGIQPRCRS